MFKRILVLINPVAGSEGILLRSLHSYIHKHQISADIRITTQKEDVKRIVQETKKELFDALVVYGGDGTINEAVQAIDGMTIPLLILPGGTANILAKELRIPEELPQAIKLLTSKNVKKRAIDVCTANGKTFILRVSTGPLADMILQADTSLKKAIGKMAYGISFIKELQKARKITYNITIDSKEIIEEGISLLAVNSGNIGFTGMTFHPTIKIDDGILDIFIIKESDIGYLSGTVKDALIDGKFTNLLHLKGKKVNVTMSTKQPITCDDTRLDTDTLSIELAHKKVSIIVPAK